MKKLLLLLILMLFVVGCVELEEDPLPTRIDWDIILENGDIVTISAYECQLVQSHKLGSDIVHVAWCWVKNPTGWDFEKIRALGVYPSGVLVK